MSEQRKKLRRILFLTVPIMVGILVFIVLLNIKPNPPHKEQIDNKRKVRIIEIQETDVIPVAVGYGTVQPTNVWQAVAEVSGKAIYVSPSLKKGGRISKGTLLVEIDPTEYKLTVAEARANLQSIDAQVKQSIDKETSNKELLKLELHTLELKQKELDRQKKLLGNNIASKSDFEQAEAAFLAQKYKVQAIQNTLNSLDSERELLKAQEEQAKLSQQSANLQLQYTKIRAPFDSIISSVNVEKLQFIQKGQSIAEAESVDSVEIEAQLANGLHVFRPQLDEEVRSRLIQGNGSIGDTLGITAKVKFNFGKMSSEWQGKVMRFNAQIDTQTRTPGIIVQVDDPFGLKSGIPKRPLIKGMYCEVELYGSPFKNAIIIPRTALHDKDTVYIADENNRLRFRKVKTGFTQDSFTMIREGLAPGEKVIVTDVVPAVEGMGVIPVLDLELAAKIKADAMGGGK